MTLDFGDEELRQIPGYLYATCGDKRFHPDKFVELFHGAQPHVEAAFREHRGLPGVGNDLDLIKHATHPPGYDPSTSAFRGSVEYPGSPGFMGAADWVHAGKGIIFCIKLWSGYDLGKLDPHVPNGRGTFGGVFLKEKEIAIPARVPKRFVAKIADVRENNRGQLIPVWRSQIYATANSFD